MNIISPTGGFVNDGGGIFRGAALWFDVLSPIGFSFSGTYRICIVVVSKIHESIVCLILISDRDFTTALPPKTSFSFSEKEKEGKRKTAQGVHRTIKNGQ